MSKNSEFINTQNQTESELSSKIDMRIETVNDPRINKALFSLYEQLIEPLKQIEVKISRVNDLQKAIDNNEYYAKHTFSHMMCFTKHFFVPLMILNIVIIGMMGKSDNELLGAIYSPLVYFWDHYLYEHNDLDYVLLIYLLVVRPALTAIIPKWLTEVVINKKHTTQNKKYQIEIDELMPTINRDVDDISKAVCFVPSNYRYSQALSFFVDAYANSKIDNLKEAVNLYDTNKYRQCMLDYQKRTVELLQTIAFSEFE